VRVVQISAEGNVRRFLKLLLMFVLMNYEVKFLQLDNCLETGLRCETLHLCTHCLRGRELLCFRATRTDLTEGKCENQLM
jgi:hypothetical protein